MQEIELVEGQQCPFCEDVYSISVTDYDLNDRWFLFTTCCEESYHRTCLDMRSRWSRRQFVEWFRCETGERIRAVWVDDYWDGASNMPVVLDLGLVIHPLRLEQANQFIEQHHRHNGRINQWKFGAGIWNGRDLVGIVSVEPPRARCLKERNATLEVTRVCIREDLQPRQLVANACSLAYGFACREAGRRGYRKVITYTRVDEIATSVKASGFTEAFRQTKAKSWSCKSRPRQAPKTPPVPKIRWEREVRKAA